MEHQTILRLCEGRLCCRQHSYTSTSLICRPGDMETVQRLPSGRVLSSNRLLRTHADPHAADLLYQWFVPVLTRGWAKRGEELTPLQVQSSLQVLLGGITGEWWGSCSLMLRGCPTHRLPTGPPCPQTPSLQPAAWCQRGMPPLALPCA